MQNLPARGTILPLAFVTAALKPANLPSGVSGARVTQCNNGLPERGVGLTNGTVNKFGISGQDVGVKFVNNGMDLFISIFGNGPAGNELLSVLQLVLTVMGLDTVLGTTDIPQVLTSSGMLAEVSIFTVGKVDTSEDTTPEVLGCSCGSGLIPNPPMLTADFLRCSGGKHETAGKKQVSDDTTDVVLLTPSTFFTPLCAQDDVVVAVDDEWNGMPVVASAML